MSIPHHQFFEDIIRKVEAIETDTVAALVSSEGLVLCSNVTDADREAQLASYAATYLDNGRKMFSARPTSEKESPEDVQAVITVGHARFVILAQVVAGSMLVISGTDKSKISIFLKMAMDEVARVTHLLETKEILF